MANSVLSSTQTTSDTFVLTGYIGWVSVENHQGGTWTLQYESEDGTSWISTNRTWDSDGVQNFQLPPLINLRLTGGTVGATARAWPTPPI